jgi:RNA polymerase sigma factor for flagellar operon FliA
MNPEETFRANLPLIKRIVGRVCRRARMETAEAEDFASSVHIALMENDYAVFRKLDGASSLAAYLTVVVQRLLIDERERIWGRWRPSAEARRWGDVGTLLERMYCRDGLPLESVLPAARALDPSITGERLAAMAARLPSRTSRPRAVDVGAAELAGVASMQTADANVVTAELHERSATVSETVRHALAALPLEDRAVIRFRFREEMSVADIARMLRLPQRALYRRLDQLLARLRQLLLARGIDTRDAGELIGSSLQTMDFGLDEGGAQ